MMYDYKLHLVIRPHGLACGSSQGNSLLRIGLTADKDSIPIGMNIFVGKEIGKDQQKKLAEEIKTRFDIEDKILDVTEEETNDAKSIEEDFQWIKSGIGTADKEETV